MRTQAHRIADTDPKRGNVVVRLTDPLLLPIALLTLGVAMFRTPAFGKGYGWVSVTLGVAGVAAAVALLVDVSEIAVVVILALIVFHLALGWKVYSLSRAS